MEEAQRVHEINGILSYYGKSHIKDVKITALCEEVERLRNEVRYWKMEANVYKNERDNAQALFDKQARVMAAMRGQMRRDNAEAE